MPEPRIGDVVGSDAGVSRTPSSAVKAAGDSMTCTTCPHQQISRSSNKHKTPRSVRYDLENALVGLCDVWFGEIKPYLMRNNIKMHVNCSSASGDHQRPADHASYASPRFDPGAAPDNPPPTARYAGFSAPLAARTARRDLTADPSRRPQSSLLAEPQKPLDGTQVQSTNNEQKNLGQPSIHRRRRRQSQPEPSCRVPRLCRTHSMLSRPGDGAGSRGAKSISYPPPQTQPPCDDFYRFILPRRKFVMKNKSTQTEQAQSVSKGCQSLQPRYCDRSPRRLSHHQPSPRRAEPELARATGGSGSSPHPPILPPRVICRFKRPETLAAEMPPFLQDDLIEIIAEGNERRLKLLYSSSEKDGRDQASLMNLMTSSQEKPANSKLPPWR